MNALPKPPQIINGFACRVVRNRNTLERFIRTDAKPFCAIPLDIARLAAGQDSWMRQIVVKCSYCDNRQPVGETECGTCCRTCFDAQGEENARLDGLTS